MRAWSPGCSGCGADAPAAVPAPVAAVRAVGLSLFAEPDPALDPAESLLRSSYLVQLVERAVG